MQSCGATVVFLDGVLAPDFIGIGPRGFMLTKDAWLGQHRSGDLKYESFEGDEVTVRTYGDAAILTSHEARLMSEPRFTGRLSV